MNEYKIPNGFNIIRLMQDFKPMFRTTVNEFPQVKEFGETIPQSIELAIEKVNEIKQYNNQEVS